MIISHYYHSTHIEKSYVLYIIHQQKWSLLSQLAADSRILLVALVVLFLPRLRHTFVSRQRQIQILQEALMGMSLAMDPTWRVQVALKKSWVCSYKQMLVTALALRICEALVKSLPWGNPSIWHEGMTQTLNTGSCWFINDGRESANQLWVTTGPSLPPSTATEPGWSQWHAQKKGSIALNEGSGSEFPQEICINMAVQERVDMKSEPGLAAETIVQMAAFCKLAGQRGQTGISID